MKPRAPLVTSRKASPVRIAQGNHLFQAWPFGFVQTDWGTNLRQRSDSGEFSLFLIKGFPCS